MWVDQNKCISSHIPDRTKVRDSFFQKGIKSQGSHYFASLKSLNNFLSYSHLILCFRKSHSNSNTLLYIKNISDDLLMFNPLNISIL